MKHKADKTDVFRLESEKAEKSYVQGEFDWIRREFAKTAEMY